MNSLFAFLIAAGLYFTRNGVTDAFLLNLIFYIIITPVIMIALTRNMFMRKNAMIVTDALQRIDTVLEMKPLPETSRPAHPADASVELSHVAFSYNSGQNALHEVSPRIRRVGSWLWSGPPAVERPPSPVPSSASLMCKTDSGADKIVVLADELWRSRVRLNACLARENGDYRRLVEVQTRSAACTI